MLALVDGAERGGWPADEGKAVDEMAGGNLDFETAVRSSQRLSRRSCPQ